MKTITLSELLQFFESKEEAVKYQELVKINLQKDIESLNPNNYRDFFAQPVLTASINNNGIGELLRKFQSDVIDKLKEQIKECDDNIAHINSL